MEKENPVKSNESEAGKEKKRTLHELVSKIGELLNKNSDADLEEAFRLTQELESRMKNGQ